MQQPLAAEADGLLLLGSEVRINGENRDPHTSSRPIVVDSQEVGLSLPPQTRPSALVMPSPHPPLQVRASSAADMTAPVLAGIPLHPMVPIAMTLPPQLLVPVLLQTGGIKLITVIPDPPPSSAPLTTRQKILARWRIKRARMKLDVERRDEEKSKRARVQPRSSHGVFISDKLVLAQQVEEMAKKVTQSEATVASLHARLTTTEQELHSIQLIASPEEAQNDAQVEQQENSALQSPPPPPPPLQQQSIPSPAPAASGVPISTHPKTRKRKSAQ